MTNQTLILEASGTAAMLALLFVLVLVLILLVVSGRYLSRIGKQRDTFRRELSKLVDELEQVRKQAQETDKGKSSDAPR